MVYYIQHRYFYGLHPLFNSKMKTRRFGIWLCSRPQAKKYLLCWVNWKGLIPVPGRDRLLPSDPSEYLKMEGEPVPETGFHFGTKRCMRSVQTVFTENVCPDRPVCCKHMKRIEVTSWGACLCVHCSRCCFTFHNRNSLIRWIVVTKHSTETTGITKYRISSLRHSLSLIVFSR
jgi:hypothetical protein